MKVLEKRKELAQNIKHNIQKVSPRIRVLDKATEIADLVLSKQEKYEKMSSSELRNLSYRMMDEIASGKPLDNFLIDGLAIAREMIYRVHHQRAYKVQIIGAIVAHFGDFAEMKTGEGKTLTLLLVSYVNALTRKGVHIVTVNEYLVERDMNFSQQALGELGITVGYITSSMQAEQKKKMYACDITYVSNSELGFDYLRDNMVENVNDKMQRGLNFAIIDEADSVLIDEARTPLIIAANPDEGVGQYIEVDKFVKTLTPDDYVIDLESHAINLNDLGIKKTEKYFNIKNLYDIKNSELVHKIMNSLRANYIMEIGKEYVVKFNKKKSRNEIALVDSFTGRIMEGRMYSAGLHQAIQAKEGVEIDPENVTVATITYQSFFRLYKKIAGFSGTALTEKNEFLNIYNMVVVDIPTNKPVIRIDQPDYIFASKQTKWKYVVAEIKRRHEIGQPVLVGTVSVEDSELLHRLLEHVHIPHNVLNAKNNAQEAEIVKNAGQKGAVTIATNMAGRGTDIKLGPGVRELGGLYVLGTERNESRRIDNQLRGRSGRQGDPGESRFFISLQDSLFKRFAGDKFDKAQYKLGEDVIDLKFFSKLLDRTQKRVENMNFDIRKNLIDYDYVLSEQRELIYKQRNTILTSDNLFLIVKKMVPRIVDVIISVNRDKENVNMVDIDKVIEELKNKVGIDISNERNFLKDKHDNELHYILTNEITNVIKQKYLSEPSEEINNQWRKIIINSLDRNWTKFLDKIQKLRDGVALRSFEQKSPLNIYVEDSDRLFYNITISIAEEVVSTILNSSTSEQGQKIVLELKSPKENLDPEELKKEVIEAIKVVESIKADEIKEVTLTTIDDLALSPKVNDSENKPETKQDADLKDVIMNENDNNQLKNNVNNVVDEILGLKSTPETISNHEHLDIIIDKAQPSVPPPIPSNVNNATNVPPPIPTVSRPQIPNNSEDDFLKQVLNVVDNDIDAEPVDLSMIDEMVREENKFENKNDDVFKTTISNPTSSLNDFVKEKEEVIEYVKPTDGRFEQDDDLKLEDYHHNLRIEKGDIFEFERIQDDFNKKNIELINKKYESVIQAKDQNINDLINKNKELEIAKENDKLDYAKQLEDIYNNENSQLKQMQTQYEDLVDEKEKLEEDLYQFQLKELQHEQERLLAEKDAIILERRKLEEERLLQEEMQRKELERIEKERAEQEHLARMKAQHEALAEQKAVIEQLIAEQKRLLEEQNKQTQQQANQQNFVNNRQPINKNQVVSLSQAKGLGGNGRSKNAIPSRFSK